jgi:hypothetical protein
MGNDRLRELLQFEESSCKSIMFNSPSRSKFSRFNINNKTERVSFPVSSLLNLNVKCGKCNITIIELEKRENNNYVKCRCGHAICMNCWHEYICDILNQPFPLFICCAKVSPTCKSTYSIDTLIDHLSLREYRQLMEIYGDSISCIIDEVFHLSVPSVELQRTTFVRKQDYYVPLPFSYPKNWLIYF